MNGSFSKTPGKGLFTTALMLACLSACGGSAGVTTLNPTDNPPSPLEDFRALLLTEAGPASTNCGTAAANAVTTTVDDCVASALTANTSFYAIYELNGIDSTVADGVSLDAAGVTRIWTYDSSTTGQLDNGPVGVSSTVCNQPVFSNGTGRISSRIQCVIDVDQFQQTLQMAAGTDSEFCGRVEASITSIATDTCIENAFSTRTPFYAVYMLQGIDSTVAEGISFNSMNELFFWDYDSSITGQGNAGPSRVIQQQCVNPVFQGGNGSIETRFGCYITIAQFQEQVKTNAGAASTFCGITEPGDDLAGINQCVEEAFNNGTAFYAIYRRLQAIESSVAQAISGSSFGSITLWDYSSGITQQGIPGPTDIQRTPCANPEYVGGGGAVETIFSCQ